MDDWLESSYVTELQNQSSEELVDFYQQQSDVIAREKPELLGLSYGTHERQTIDAFLPSNGLSSTATPHPAILFFHGGYWMTNSSASRRFLAQAWIDKGVALILANYRISPEGTISDMVDDAVAAMCFLVKQAPSLNICNESIVLAGNSAGAHLAAMAATRVTRPPIGLCLLSGLYDLRPLLKTSIAGSLALTMQEAFENSPILLEPADVPAAIFVGEAETPAFKAQSAALQAQREAHGFSDCYQVLEEQNHFSIIAEVGKVDSPIGKAVSKLIDS